MNDPKKRNALAVACLFFLSLGMITASLGPVLPELARNNSTNLAAIGSIYTALFLGALASQVVAGPLGDRFGQRPVLAVGVVLMALGAAGLTLTPVLPLTLALAVLAGLGHGAIDLGGNVMIANLFARRSVTALNLLNLFYGVGAFGGPALVSLLLKRGGAGLPVIWLGVAVVLAALPFVVRIPEGRPDPAGHKSSSSAAAIYRSPVLWVLGMILLVYVGTENGLGGWISTYLQNTAAFSADRGAMVAAWFWLALTGGRLISALLGTRLSPQAVLFISLGGAALGGVLLAASTGNAALSVASIFLIGLSFGSVFPTMLAITTGIFTGGPGKAGGVVTAMGSVGGMILPWAQGVLLEKVSSAAAAQFTAVMTLVMLLLFSGVQLSARRAARASAQPELKSGSNL